MSKHTPGPWEWTFRGLYAGNKPVLVPHYEYGEPIIRSRDADDVLIAAAPDLLAACEQLQSALGDMFAGWRYIQKHHGRLDGVGWERCNGDAALAMQAAFDAVAKAKGEPT